MRGSSVLVLCWRDHDTTLLGYWIHDWWLHCSRDPRFFVRHDAAVACCHCLSPRAVVSVDGRAGLALRVSGLLTLL